MGIAKTISSAFLWAIVLMIFTALLSAAGVGIRIDFFSLQGFFVLFAYMVSLVVFVKF